MVVVFDATMLSLLLHQTARLPCFPGTKTQIVDARERIETLLTELAKQNATILVPAPALTEFLCLVDEAGPGYLKTINKKSSFEVAPFDEKAAIEAAEIIKKLRKDFGHKSGPQSDEPWQKVKVDQQIVAIAKAENVDCLYTADGGMVNTAKALKVPATGLWDLPLPPYDKPLLAGLNDLSSSEPEPPS